MSRRAQGNPHPSYRALSLGHYALDHKGLEQHAGGSMGNGSDLHRRRGEPAASDLGRRAGAGGGLGRIWAGGASRSIRVSPWYGRRPSRPRPALVRQRRGRGRDRAGARRAAGAFCTRSRRPSGGSAASPTRPACSTSICWLFRGYSCRRAGAGNPAASAAGRPRLRAVAPGRAGAGLAPSGDRHRRSRPCWRLCRPARSSSAVKPPSGCAFWPLSFADGRV